MWYRNPTRITLDLPLQWQWWRRSGIYSRPAGISRDWPAKRGEARRANTWGRGAKHRETSWSGRCRLPGCVQVDWRAVLGPRLASELMIGCSIYKLKWFLTFLSLWWSNWSHKVSCKAAICCVVVTKDSRSTIRHSWWSGLNIWSQTNVGKFGSGVKSTQNH